MGIEFKPDDNLIKSYSQKEFNEIAKGIMQRKEIVLDEKGKLKVLSNSDTTILKPRNEQELYNLNDRIVQLMTYAKKQNWMNEAQRLRLYNKRFTSKKVKNPVDKKIHHTVFSNIFKNLSTILGREKQKKIIGKRREQSQRSNSSVKNDVIEPTFEASLQPRTKHIIESLKERGIEVTLDASSFDVASYDLSIAKELLEKLPPGSYFLSSILNRIQDNYGKAELGEFLSKNSTNENKPMAMVCLSMSVVNSEYTSAAREYVDSEGKEQKRELPQLILSLPSRNWTSDQKSQAKRNYADIVRKLKDDFQKKESRNTPHQI